MRGAVLGPRGEFGSRPPPERGGAESRGIFILGVPMLENGKINPDSLRGLYCSLPRRHWSNRFVLALKVYIDDSGVGQPPVSVLAGWVADLETWIRFSDAWDGILRMSPRINYFKYEEAKNSNGEFFGISEARRNEKLRLLGNVIRDHKLLGIRAVIDDVLFKKYQPFIGLNWPYPLLHVQIIMRIHRHIMGLYSASDKIPPVDFIFDQQYGEEQGALEAWYSERARAVGRRRDLYNSPPAFVDDKENPPLQAADLHAGWAREINAAEIDGSSINSIWGDGVDEIKVINWVATEEEMSFLMRRLLKNSSNL